MNLEEIKELIGLMRKNKIQEIDLEQEGSKVRIVSASPEPPRTEYIHIPPPAPAYALPAAPQPAAPAVPVAPPPPAAAQAAPTPVPPVPQGVEIKSPMVGTFYRAPSPDSPPYVEVGSVINTDSVLCIVEAMKLMNEIKSEIRGKILRALVENGQPVEFNQPLFVVEPF